MGDADYDAACVSTAMALAKSADFDGIFWDEINPVPGYAISQTCINAYQATGCSLYNGNGDYTAWQNNTLVLLKQIAAYDQASGMKSIINDGSGTSAQWDAWGGLTGISGQMEESCIGFSDGRPVPYSQWQIEVANMRWSESNHRYAMCLHYDDGQDRESPDTYGLASMLLVADGYSSYNSTVTRLSQGSFAWWPEYTTAQNLGVPTSGYTTIRSGSATVYERRFANGIVVVNPTSASSGTVALGGTYSGTGNEPTHVSSVMLRPQTGLVLTTAP
jgi:hypothetical protein